MKFIKELRKYVTNHPNMHVCLKSAASISNSSAACERSFTSIQRLKLWTRKTMYQDDNVSIPIEHYEGLYKKRLEGRPFRYMQKLAIQLQ